MFYNVENLYDTINDPTVDDEEFLPSGKKEWGANRYQKKLDDLARVIAADGVPHVLGLCEIENRAVVEDLVARTPLAASKLQVVHFNSPDNRGVDVALAYNPKVLRPLKTQTIKVEMPQAERPTRDILYVVMKTRSDTFHFFVNHWPSRSGGQDKSVHKRAIAAQTLRNITDSILGHNSAASIVIMGDLNDEPADSSIANVLGAGCLNTMLINTMCPLKEAGNGTYSYSNKWQVLDHFIVSKTLTDRKQGWAVKSGSIKIVHHEWMMYKNNKGELEPNRTYGRSYFGGYSDHLPIRITLVNQ